MLTSMRKAPGALRVNSGGGGAVVKTILLRSNTANVHAGAGVVTTNVDISSLGITDATKVKCRYLGRTVSTNAGVAHVNSAIRLASTTVLEVKTQTDAATTATVYWIIEQAMGTVERGTTAVTVAGGNEVLVNVTLSNTVPSLTTAREAWLGNIFATNVNAHSRVELTSTSNLAVYGSSTGTGDITVSWEVDRA